MARSGSKTCRKDLPLARSTPHLHHWRLPGHAAKTGIDPRTQAPGQQRKQVQNSRRPFTQIAHAWFEHHSASWSNSSFRVWPLQLLFHNIGWYLLFEEDAIGTDVGLIRSERIDRLALRRSERGNRRSDAPHVLEPGSPNDTHPYPVELDLPPWTMERDIDLRNWLFGFGAGIRIDSPEALKNEHRQKLETALAV